MKDKVFYGKGMQTLKKEDEELYKTIVDLNENVWNGKALDYKTQKLIAIGIAASNNDNGSIKKQMTSAKKELNVTKDEVFDVLKIVLLTSGMPPFTNSVRILNEVYNE